MIADALITEDRLPRFQIIYTSENLAGLNQRSMVFIRADEFERLKAAMEGFGATSYRLQRWPPVGEFLLLSEH